MKKLFPAFLIVASMVSCQQVIDAKLTAVANEVNKSCPMLIDKETRLDNVMAMPGKTLQYSYTLVNYSKADIDTAIKKSKLSFRPASSLVK